MIIEGKESAVMRETWVDYAKGIGIILVVFGHANRGLYSSGIYISPEIYHYLDNIIYSFHMPLFFFLSGLFFVSSIKNKSKGIFLWGKVKNVIYPYVVWSLIQGGLRYFSLNIRMQRRVYLRFCYSLFIQGPSFGSCMLFL